MTEKNFSSVLVYSGRENHRSCAAKYKRIATKAKKFDFSLSTFMYFYF